MSSDYVLEMKNIHKRFGGVQALKGVDIKVKKGEVHALMGENGAGKSTLMKILLGIFTLDEGEIFIKGNKVEISNAKDAIDLGVSMIYQELSPIPYMTVAENIYLGRESINPKTKLVDFREMNKKTEEILEYINLDVKPTDHVANLNVARIQMVEIAKAISFNSDIIIMDEPTSALSDREVENLFKAIQTLKESGVTIIYISHKMDEIYKICDSVTVLRDGEYIGADSLDNLEINQLISMMVGREISEMFPKLEAEISDVVMEVKDLCREGEFENISFTLRKGEILGVAGLMGAGRTEVVESIFGIRQLDKGEIFLNGSKVEIKHPEDAIRHKIGIVPEDRKNFGLVLKLAVKDNVIMAAIKKCMGKFFVTKKLESKYVNDMIQKLQIKVPNMFQTASSLSGGNQQKVVIAKCLFTDPDIIILDEPTRGIDVKTKSEIHLLMSKLAQQGKSILMISSEMPEVIGMSDRVIVLHEGKMTGELSREEATQEKIMELAMS